MLHSLITRPYETAYKHVLNGTFKRIHPAELLRQLNMQNDYGDTGWVALAQNTSLQRLHDVLAYVRNVENASAQLLESLGKQDNDGLTGWQLMAGSAAQTLRDIVEFVKDVENAPTQLLETLGKQSNDAWTGWQTVMRYVPDALPDLLQIVEKEKTAPAQLLEALGKQNNYGWTGWQIAARKVPNALPTLLRIVRKEKTAPTQLSEALSKQNNKGVTGWQMVEEYAPKFKPGLLKFVQAVSDPASNHASSSSERKKSKTDIYNDLVNLVHNPEISVKEKILACCNAIDPTTQNGKTLYKPRAAIVVSFIAKTQARLTGGELKLVMELFKEYLIPRIDNVADAKVLYAELNRIICLLKDRPEQESKNELQELLKLRIMQSEFLELIPNDLSALEGKQLIEEIQIGRAHV
jgi:hypothetical protein